MSDSNDFTIADVAKAAGVSVSTVSRILNGKQDVAQQTRERVQQVIEQLGYSPHAQAQRLRAGKTRNIALLFPALYHDNHPYSPLDLDFIIGASAAAGNQDFFFNLTTTDVTKRNLLNMYRSAQVDGLVLMQIHMQDWRVELLRQHGYPFVMIGHTADNTGISFIDLDFEATVLMAFEHLVNLGHRYIGFLALPTAARQQGFGPAVRAWLGYEQALHKHNLAPLYRECGYGGENIFDAMLALLDEQPGLTAVVSGHGIPALNIMRALGERGRSVPDDCSVISIVTNRIAEMTAPPMTNIDFPSYTMGYQAIEMLIRMLEQDSAQPDQILIPPRLVLRQSTGPAR
jgi:DNA-binding LacI/PurR family transcriptional regulator